MNLLTPHYLLSSEANRNGGSGRWRFLLLAADNSARFEASDVEPDVWGERLDLLTVVRALESLDQPSRITLISCSRYVEQGIRFGLPEWRENGWRWEAFGQMVAIRDADLWQRMDRVLQFHHVQCGQRRVDRAGTVLAGPHWRYAQQSHGCSGRVGCTHWVKYVAPVLALGGMFLLNILARGWHHVGKYALASMMHRSYPLHG